MIITENEGLNLNSITVQNMIKDWPQEKLDNTKFHYGRMPTVETVSVPSPQYYEEMKDAQPLDEIYYNDEYEMEVAEMQQTPEMMQEELRQRVQAMQQQTTANQPHYYQPPQGQQPQYQQQPQQPQYQQQPGQMPYMNTNQVPYYGQQQQPQYDPYQQQYAAPQYYQQPQYQQPQYDPYQQQYQQQYAAPQYYQQPQQQYAAPQYYQQPQYDPYQQPQYQQQYAAPQYQQQPQYQQPSTPGYFDFNQPGGHIPTVLPNPNPMEKQFTMSVGDMPTDDSSDVGTSLAEALYRQKMNTKHISGGNSSYRSLVGAPVTNPFGSNNNDGPKEHPCAHEIKIPHSMHVPHYDHAIQPNLHNPLPSRGLVNNLTGYAQPSYYTPIAAPAVNNYIYQQGGVDELYRRARHNYAVAYGFKNAEELEENDRNMMKAISRAVSRSRGLSEEETEARIKKYHDDPYLLSKGIIPEDMKKQMEEAAAQRERERRPDQRWHVKVIKNGEVIKEFDPKKDKFPDIDLNRDVYGEFEMSRRMKEHTLQTRDYVHSTLYHTAMEREYDNCGGCIAYFNEVFPLLHQRDLRREDAKRGTRLMAKAWYNQGDFKREMLRRYGPPGIRRRLSEEDFAFHKTDNVPENIVKGSYGKMPLGVPLDEGSDPRLGYCFELDLETGKLKPTPPVSAEVIERRRQDFKDHSKMVREQHLADEARKKARREEEALASQQQQPLSPAYMGYNLGFNPYTQQPYMPPMPGYDIGYPPQQYMPGYMMQQPPYMPPMPVYDMGYPPMQQYTPPIPGYGMNYPQQPTYAPPGYNMGYPPMQPYGQQYVDQNPIQAPVLQSQQPTPPYGQQYVDPNPIQAPVLQNQQPTPPTM